MVLTDEVVVEKDMRRMGGLGVVRPDEGAVDIVDGDADEGES